MLRLNQIRLFILLSLIVTITSCSVEKRRYTSGYHVEWYKRDQKKVVQKDAEELASVQEHIAETNQTEVPNSNPTVNAELTTTEENVLIVENEKDLVADNNSDAILTQKIKPSIAERFIENSKVAQKIQNSATLNALAEKSKKKGKLGVVSAITGAGSWVAIIVDAVLITVFWETTTVATALILSLLALLLAITAFITGIMGLKKAKKGKGRGGAITGLVLSSLYFLLFIVSIVIISG
jgi:hypothetical protein